MSIQPPTPADLPTREPSPLTMEEMKALLLGETTIEQITAERDAPIRAAEVEWYAAQFEKDLQQDHTRLLLKKRHSHAARDVGTHLLMNVGECATMIDGYDIALRRVLATREHIPTKAEAKRLRQEKARQAQGRRKR